jgi:hypothetical protein
VENPFSEKIHILYSAPNVVRVTKMLSGWPKCCQVDQNIDDKMWEPQAIKKEDGNANNMKERKRHTNIQENKNTLRLTI